jgi:hypothetical protein
MIANNCGSAASIWGLQPTILLYARNYSSGKKIFRIDNDAKLESIGEYFAKKLPRASPDDLESS